MIDASRMVKDAGIELSQYVLLGLGGKELWREHAVESARVLSAMDPDFIRVRTLLIRPDAPLYEMVVNGEFVPVTQEEVLKEIRLLIENLDVHSEFCSDHITNIVNINGRLPGDKERMLEKLDDAIAVMARQPQDRNWAVDREGIRGV
jgi:radical SAM superfamily enzyme